MSPLRSNEIKKKIYFFTVPDGLIRDKINVVILSIFNYGINFTLRSGLPVSPEFKNILRELPYYLLFKITVE